METRQEIKHTEVALSINPLHTPVGVLQDKGQRQESVLSSILGILMASTERGRPVENKQDSEEDRKQHYTGGARKVQWTVEGESNPGSPR